MNHKFEVGDYIIFHSNVRLKVVSEREFQENIRRPLWPYPFLYAKTVSLYANGKWEDYTGDNAYLEYAPSHGESMKLDKEYMNRKKIDKEVREWLD